MTNDTAEMPTLAAARPLIQIGHTLATKLTVALSRALLLGALIRALAPADFGAYSLVTTSVAFGLVVLGLGANQYVYRSVPGRSWEDSVRVLSSVGLFEVLFGSVMLAVAVVSGAFSSALALFHVEAYASAFALAIGWVLAELVCQDLLLFLYARQRIGQANVLDLIKQVGWIPLVLAWWVASGSLSVEVIVGASLAGAIAGALFGIIAIRPVMRPSRAVVSAALRFAVPLIISGLGFLTLKLFDRFVLSASRGLEETGVYALAASFTNLLYSFSAVVIANTLTPMAVRSHNEGDSSRRDRLLWRIMGLSLALYVAGAIALWALGVLILPRIARPEYAAALSFLPWLALGYALIIVSAAPHNALYLANRTRTILAIDLMATAVAIGLDLVLIPRYGGYGAAAATIVGFGGGAAAKFVASGLWRSFGRGSLLPAPTEIAERLRGLRRS